jgi:hypothetical protein
MSNTDVCSLHTLPVELVYRILDNLSLGTIVCSMLNVCTRLNGIVNTYHRNEVNFIYIIFRTLKTYYRLEKWIRRMRIFIEKLYSAVGVNEVSEECFVPIPCTYTSIRTVWHDNVGKSAIVITGFNGFCKSFLCINRYLLYT